MRLYRSDAQDQLVRDLGIHEPERVQAQDLHLSWRQVIGRAVWAVWLGSKPCTDLRSDVDVASYHYAHGFDQLPRRRMLDHEPPSTSLHRFASERGLVLH